MTVRVTPNVHAAFQTYDLDLTKPGYNNVCYPDAIRFKNLSIQGLTFVWDFGDNSAPLEMNDSSSVVHEFQHAGVYQVKLKARNPNTCNLEDIAIKTINYYQENIQVGNDGKICDGSTYQLVARGGSLYNWSSEDHTFSSSSASPIVQPPNTTQYFLTATDAHGCVRKDTVKVVVVDSIDVKWEHRLNANCTDRPSVSVENLTPPAGEVQYRFDFGDGTTSTDTKVEHLYEKDGQYIVKLSAQQEFCTFEKSVRLPVYTLTVPNVFTPEGSPGYNDSFQVAFGAGMLTPDEAGLAVQLIVNDRWGKRVYESPDYQNDWTGHDLVGGVYYVHLKVGDVATCKGWVHIVK
jgi:PKD repeat protein